MFRKEALRKGVLKTINANTGVMVGQPYTSPPVPAIRKPPTAFERFKVSGPVRGIKSLGRQTVNPAILGGYYAGDKVAQGLGIESPVGRMGFGLGGSYAAARMLPAVAGLGTLPSLAILGTAYGGKKLYDAGVKERARINAMSPAERKAFEIEQRNAATDYMNVSDEELFGKFVPKAPEEFETKKSAAAPKEGPGSGRPSMRVKSKELKAEGDPLLQDNVADSNDIANLDSIQENALNIDSTGMPPGPPGSTDDVLVAKAKIEDQLTDEEKKKIKEDKQTPPSGPGLVKQGDGSVIDDVVISRARQLYDKLNKGQGSQANLIFLANLASGLMTGTTAKAGIGGAMEVIGQALGPAVNNYAIAKMKENELERNSMETYLGYALEELKLFNEAAQGEPFDGDKGIIQFVDQSGVTRNVKGRESKDGTMEVATGRLDNNGRMIYVPVGSEGVEGYGSPVQFFDKKTVDANTQKVGETLSNRYKTYKIANDVLDILNTQPTAGGPRGTIDLYVNRFGGALSDVFGRSNPTKSDAEALYNNLKIKIETNDTYTEKEKKLLLNKLDFGNVYKDAEKRIKERTGKIDSDTLEKLAVAETTLVYALANSFKDQDRLTQRDVQAAEKLVNLFTLTRGSEATRSSIKAIAEELESDILRYENDYKRLGGLEITLNTMRTQNKFRPQEGTSLSTNIMQKYDAMSSEDLIKDFNQ